MKNEYEKPLIKIEHWLVTKNDVLMIVDLFKKRMATDDITIKLMLESGHNTTYEQPKEFIQDLPRIFKYKEIVNEIEIGKYISESNGCDKYMMASINFDSRYPTYLSVKAKDQDGSCKDWISGTYDELLKLKDVFDIKDKELIAALKKKKLSIAFDPNGEIKNQIQNELGIVSQQKGIKNNITNSQVQIHNGTGDNIIVDKKNNHKNSIPIKTTLWKKPETILGIIAVVIAIISIPWWPTWWPNLIKIFSVKQGQENTGINIHNKPQDETKQALLRPLDPLETGKKIGELPNEVYFFGSPLGITREIEDVKYDFLSTTSKRINNYSFEIQKIDSRYYLIGFLSDEIYSTIRAVSSENSQYAILYPNSWGGATHPVAIPFDAIYSIKDRDIDLDSYTKMGILDVGFKEVKDAPETHSN